MDLFILLTSAFVVFSLVGYWWEYLIGKRECRYFHNSGTGIPILPIYGFGAIIIYLLYYICRKMGVDNVIVISLIATVVVTIFECCSGYLYGSLVGEPGWNYNYIPGCICSGYGNIFISFGWFLIILGLLMLDPIFIPRINALL